MKIAVLGATGHVGAAITAELSRRGHAVTAIARNVAAITPAQGVVAQAGDASDPAALAPLLAGHDAVISALRHDIAPSVLISAVKQAGVDRLLVTGGAGSLMTPGGRLIDQPEFPAEFRPFAMQGVAFLEELRLEEALTWTFFSPAAHIFDGPRTGTFRLGTTSLVSDANGQSAISYADYAVAMVDELEVNRHPRQQFTIGY